ncbi:MAG: hypothetical protein J1D77_01920 [Muribaculaceae bacterium]|nr:hypothetical protein [Muribaculaceae bacterium]
MKKSIVSMMLAVALLSGGSLYAQSQTDGTTGATTKKENCGNCEKGQTGKEGKGKKGSQGLKGKKFNPFDGIQLTDDQQQKLQVLQQGLGPVELTPEQQAQIPENKNLTPEQKKQIMEERQAKKLEAKKNYLKGVKETLTPDQYVVFLENCYLYAPQNQFKGHKQGMKPGARNHKGDKGSKGNKGDKGEKQKSKK